MLDIFSSSVNKDLFLGAELYDVTSLYCYKGREYKKKDG